MADSEAKDDSKDRVGYFSHAVERKDLKPGDHIYCNLLILGLGTKHGIYTGDKTGSREAEVLYYSGSGVRSCSLDEFLDGSQLRLVAYGASVVGNLVKRGGAAYVDESRPAKEVLEAANECRSDPSKLKGIKDGETWAAYCKTGSIYIKMSWRDL